MPQEGTFALTAVVEQESIEDQWEQHFRQGSSRCKGSAVGGAWGREGLRQAGLGGLGRRCESEGLLGGLQWRGGTWLDDNDDFNGSKHRFQDKLAVLFSLYRKGAGLCGHEPPPPPPRSELASWEHWRPRAGPPGGTGPRSRGGEKVRQSPLKGEKARAPGFPAGVSLRSAGLRVGVSVGRCFFCPLYFPARNICMETKHL